MYMYQKRPHSVRAPKALTYLIRNLGWTILNDSAVDVMTNKLRDAIKEATRDYPDEKFSYRFVKYSRYHKKKQQYVYGLALVGWRHMYPYAIAPNLYSYFEKTDPAAVNEIISNIVKDFDMLLILNEQFITYNEGVFVIPVFYYYRKEAKRNSL